MQGAREARRIYFDMINEPFPDFRDCPDCGGFLFRPGPRGGLSQNVECVGCLSRFNVTRIERQHLSPNYSGPAPIVWVERIQRHGEWREDMFPKVLE